MTVIVTNKESAKHIFQILKVFAKHSGLSINLHKSEGMWIGSDKKKTEQLFGIKWPKSPIRALGIYLSYNKDASAAYNFEDKIDKLIKRLHWWKSRNLSLTGRVLIVKSLGLSTFSLLASLIHVSTDVIKRINTIVYNFIWNSKTDKVKRQIVQLDYCDGGLRMLDFETMVTCAKIKWINRYFDGSSPDWKYSFGSFCCKENLSIFLRSNFDLKELPKNIPNYYYDSLKAWYFLRSKQVMERNQFIWYNSNIKINKKSVFCKSLFNAGIWQATDLYREKKIIPFEELVLRGAKKADFLIWKGIVTCISKCLNCKNDNDYELDIGYFEVNNDKYVSIDNASSQQISDALRMITKMALKNDDYKAHAKFETVHGNISFPIWKQIYLLPGLCKVDNRCKDIQYKILFRILPTNRLLYKMNILSSDKCSLCHMYRDDLEHSLWDCLIVKNFWLNVADVWNVNNECTFHPSLETVTFGFFKEGDSSINRMMLVGKRYIYQCKRDGFEPNGRQFIQIYNNQTEHDPF